MNIKDILIRAAKTFIQAFLPVLFASLKIADVTDLNEWKAVGYTALIAAASAGLSAVMNFVRQIFSPRDIQVVYFGEYEGEDPGVDITVNDEDAEPEETETEG